jgi:hypothetical protein
MGVGGVKGGGKGGGAKGVKGAGAKGGVGKTFSTGKVDPAQGAVGPSGLAGASGVAGADPITAAALEIARYLKAGEIKTKEEAAKRLVAEILKEKLRMKSNALSQKISEALTDDPRLNQALERLWSKG